MAVQDDLERLRWLKKAAEVPVSVAELALRTGHSHESKGSVPWDSADIWDCMGMWHIDWVVLLNMLFACLWFFGLWDAISRDTRPSHAEARLVCTANELSSRALPETCVMCPTRSPKKAIFLEQQPYAALVFEHVIIHFCTYWLPYAAILETRGTWRVTGLPAPSCCGLDLRSLWRMCRSTSAEASLRIVLNSWEASGASGITSLEHIGTNSMMLMFATFLSNPISEVISMPRCSVNCFLHLFAGISFTATSHSLKIVVHWVEFCFKQQGGLNMLRRNLLSDGDYNRSNRFENLQWGLPTYKLVENPHQIYLCGTRIIDHRPHQLSYLGCPTL